MNDAFEKVFGAEFENREIVANPFLSDIKPYLRDLKKLFETQSLAFLSARMEAAPSKAAMYGENAVQLRYALEVVRKGQYVVEEGSPTGRRPQERREALEELQRMLSGMSEEQIEALPGFSEIGVCDVENSSAFWHVDEIEETLGLLREVYASPEEAEDPGAEPPSAEGLPDLRPLLAAMKDVGDFDEEEWSPETLRYEVDDMEYTMATGEKLLQPFGWIMPYSIEYGGDEPGNASTTTVYLCPDHRLKDLRQSLRAICKTLRRWLAKRAGGESHEQS